jgi:hypothetical protein
MFDDEKIELIEGRLVLVSPEGVHHATVVTAQGPAGQAPRLSPVNDHRFA